MRKRLARWPTPSATTFESPAANQISRKTRKLGAWNRLSPEDNSRHPAFPKNDRIRSQQPGSTQPGSGAYRLVLVECTVLCWDGGRRFADGCSRRIPELMSCRGEHASRPDTALVGGCCL